jgi:hypothetical protein
MYNPTKSKPKIDPMTMDFDFMIKNHPEFFTKLSWQNFEHPPLSPPPTRLPPALGDLSRLSSAPDDFIRTAPLPGAFLDLTSKRNKSWQFGGGRRVGGAGATLKPKIYPPTLMRNAPKRFFK